MYNKYLNENDCKPSEAKAKIIGDLNASIERCLDLKISSMGDIEASRGSLYFSKPDHPNEFDFNVLSSGEKEVVDLLLDIYLRKDEYSDSIFLFDEPELHISTAIQKNLLHEIDRLVGENCQIWLATHSIGFLRTIQEEMRGKCQVVQFRPEYELGSKPYILTPMRTSQANWRDIFSIALDDLAHLVSPKRIIYCEGRDSPGRGGAERGLDAKVYNTIFAEAYPDTLFISSGGNTELDQRSAVAIAILGKVFSNLEIWVLKDRDMASGKPTSEKDRILYLQNNEDNHRVLRRWEIENYLYDKEVLQKYCTHNALVFNESAYDAFVQDIDNQNLKDETAKIKNFCGITSGINPEKFKLSLSDFVSPDMKVYQDLAASIFLRQ
ncbi:AAA family ATPase [Microvirga aerophila]|uniref:AAA family ATPase n=1 Tax=Microvirga aerophila TaxID=670291 RepID=UPI001AECACBA|nr:AAA family ATPase [Microvirga aerophila]